MKNLFVLSAISLLININLQAQTNTFHVKEIGFGVMLPIMATASLPLQEKPFSTSYGFVPSLNMLTSKTHHHLMYDAGSNSVQTLNGYLLKRDVDVYLMFSKNLNSRSKYVGVGVEKVLVVNNNLLVILWSELGSNLEGAGLVSFGVTIHPQITFWARK